MQRKGFDSKPGAAGTERKGYSTQDCSREIYDMQTINLNNLHRFSFSYILNGGGLDERSSELGGSGCCGNIEAGIPPGNTGNTDGT